MKENLFHGHCGEKIILENAVAVARLTIISNLGAVERACEADNSFHLGGGLTIAFYG
jgi:hypothetical protein